MVDLDNCDVIYISGNDIYSYVYSSNTSTLLNAYFSGLTPTAMDDIAHTSTKFWQIKVGNTIDEWDITLAPFGATYNRTITIPAPYNIYAALFAINNTTLISYDSASLQIVELDITGLVATVTPKFSAPLGRSFAIQDITYTTTGKLICPTFLGGQYYISQFDYATGTLEVDVPITPTISGPMNFFVDSGSFYVINFSGAVYNIGLSSPYPITFTQNTGYPTKGASQIASCVDVVFSPPPTPTITPTNTITPTPTVTPGLYYAEGNILLPVGLPPGTVVVDTNGNCWEIIVESGTTTNLTWNGEIYPSGCTDCLAVHPCTTPTLTPTNTVTPTPTPVPLCIVSGDCQPFLWAGSYPLLYTFSSNTTTNLSGYVPGGWTTGESIGVSENYLFTWSQVNETLYQYLISYCPFQITYACEYYMSGYNFNLLAATVSDTKVVLGLNNDITEVDVDIITSAFTATSLFNPVSTLSGRIADNETLYTSTGKLLLFTSYSSGGTNYWLTQYDYPSGTVEVDVDISSITTGSSPSTIFVHNSQLYIGLLNGNIYNVGLTSPYTLTYIQNTGQFTINSGQSATCANVNLT